MFWVFFVLVCDLPSHACLNAGKKRRDEAKAKKPLHSLIDMTFNNEMIYSKIPLHTLCVVNS